MVTVMSKWTAGFLPHGAGSQIGGRGVASGAGQDWTQDGQTTLLFVDFVDSFFFFFFASILGTTVWVSQAARFPLG